jgi:hypothetical protein
MSDDNDCARLTVASARLGKPLSFCLLLIAFFVGIDLLFFAQGASFKREGGGLETVSVVLYGVALIVFFRLAPARDRLRLFHIPALMALFAMRELDLDKAFTEAGILSLKLYGGDAALSTKLIAGAVALSVVYVVLRTLRLGIPAMWSALKAGESWPWYAALAGGLVFATKLVDGLGRKLLDFGIVVSDDVSVLAATAEEIGEAFIPVCAILAMIAFWRGAAHEHHAS